MDSLDSLQIDNNRQMTQQEGAVLNKYFGEPKTNSVRNFQEFKHVLFAATLFLLLSSPYLDKVLKNLPHTDSIWMVLFLKAFVFFILLYILIIMFS
jgi:hypothetical protein